MISINVKGSSVNTLVEAYYQTAGRWFGRCPVCQRIFQNHGFYERKTPHLFGPFMIKRVYCKHCRITHALLPCFIIPYSRVLAVVKEAAITGICFNTHTIEELAELMEVDPGTVARWWKIFRQKSGVLLSALALKLAQSASLSDWARGPLETWPQRTQKTLALIGKCRATFCSDFRYCDFAWVNIYDPYLLFKRKGCPAKSPGPCSTG